MESWKLRFRMNRKASIIEEEDRMQTKDFMQATLKSIASKTQTMKFLETMNMLVELSLIKLLILLKDLIFLLCLSNQHVHQFMETISSKQVWYFHYLEEQTIDWKQKEMILETLECKMEMKMRMMTTMLSWDLTFISWWLVIQDLVNPRCSNTSLILLLEVFTFVVARQPMQDWLLL